MGYTLGIDVGGSATKIVGFTENKDVAGMLQVKAADQVTSMYGAIGRFSHEYGVPLGDITQIVLTGVGASFFDDDIYGIPTEKVDEFRAIGYGGLRLAGMAEAYVVSMGTGTAFVRASEAGIAHIGGSGVGGGTLLGLSSIMAFKTDIESILALAEDGKIENVDLLVGDIFKADIPSLPAHATAANFGKVKSTASEADFAIGAINMIVQTIGMLAVFAARNDAIKDIVLIGNLTTLPQARGTFEAIGAMHGARFTIPPNAVFATAIGAAEWHFKQAAGL